MVYRYYTQGIRSWSWFYPYIAAPLASDMVELARFPCTLEADTAASPFEQLLAVLPPKSAVLVPVPLRPLFHGALAKYYPTVFARIPDSRGREWREILLLGFVNVAALKAELAAVLRDPALFSVNEIERNTNRAALAYRFVQYIPHPLAFEV
jgi:5'-3' exonuclease